MTVVKQDISCIVLAGGKNSRMGRQKIFLRLGESTILESQIDLLREIFEEIIIVTNTPDAFQKVDTKVIRDIISGHGPIGGLYSGLAVSSNIHNFLIACDMPFINVELIHYMINQIDEHDIVIPKSSQGVETLFAIYSLNCLESIVQQIELGNFKLRDILHIHNVRYVSQEEIHDFDPEEHSFFNINTPGDYEVAKKIWQKS
jgi:molybdopterin-guanine dinucleotide biosynthesis protein A